MKNKEHNKKICHIFHHNFKNIPCYVMSEVSLKRFYFCSMIWWWTSYFKNFEIGVYRFLNSNSSKFKYNQNNTALIWTCSALSSIFLPRSISYTSSTIWNSITGKCHHTPMRGNIWSNVPLKVDRRKQSQGFYDQDTRLSVTLALRLHGKRILKI